MRREQYNNSSELWHKISTQRYEWQNEAIEEIHKEMTRSPWLKGLRVNDYSERLVLTCGIPQSGKTELVLQLLRIKKEYLRSVYHITRAEQTIGKSSTSTAISYHKSDTEEFMVINAREGIEYRSENEEDVIQILNEIRVKVEAGIYNTDIVHIYFPKHFFEKTDEKKELFTILDLPGINSSNRAEARHVEKLYKRYLPIASVIIVVCKSYKVTDFEQSDLKDKLDYFIPEWKESDSRFIMVLTSSFSSSSYLKRNIDESMSQRELIENAEKQFESESKRHLKSDNMTIIGVELGDSLSKISEYDHIKKYGEDFLPILKEQIYQNIEHVRNAIRKKKQKAPLKVVDIWINQSASILKNERGKLEADNKVWKGRRDRCEQFIERNEQLIESNMKNWKDNIEEEKQSIDENKSKREQISKMLEESKRRCMDKLQMELKSSKRVKRESIKICEEYIEKYYKDISDDYHRQTGKILNVKNLDIKSRKGLFREKAESYLKNCEDYIDEQNEDIWGQISDYFEKEKDNIEADYKMEREKKRYEELSNKYEERKKRLVEKREKICNKINENEKLSKQLECEEKQIEEIKETKQKRYRNYYVKCRNRYIRNINESENDDVRIFWMLVTGLVDYDYQHLLNYLDE